MPRVSVGLSTMAVSNTAFSFRLIGNMEDQLKGLGVAIRERVKFTNLERNLADSIVTGEVPGVWRSSAYCGAKELPTLAIWMFDLNKRVEQLGIIAKGKWWHID